VPEAYIDPDTNYEYIDTVHEIELTAEDVGPICAVGVDEIRYRVSGAIGDMFCENCENWMQMLRPDMGAWQIYTGAFGIPEESCHVIEYRGIDALGNEEEINWQCVFVDKTAPRIIKTYEGPYYATDVSEWINDETIVNVDVEDAGPHKSGVAETKYRWTMVDDEYCVGIPNGLKPL